MVECHSTTVNDTLNGPEENSILSHPIAPLPSQKIDEPLSVTVKVAVKPLVLELIVTGVASLAMPKSFETPGHFRAELFAISSSPLLSKAPVREAPVIETVSDATQELPSLKVVI